MRARSSCLRVSCRVQVDGLEDLLRRRAVQSDGNAHGVEPSKRARAPGRGQLVFAQARAMGTRELVQEVNSAGREATEGLHNNGHDFVPAARRVVILVSDVSAQRILGVPVESYTTGQPALKCRPCTPSLMSWSVQWRLD